MQCPKCGGECQVITDTYTKGKDFDGAKACCGTILTCGIIGVICGACGKGKQTYTDTYWICQKCGNKFKA